MSLLLLQGSGDWILQDDCLTLAKLAAVFREPDIENHVKQRDGGATLTIATPGGGDWSDASVAKTSVGKLYKVRGS